MPIDSVSEVATVATGDDGSRAGRRRARRTTGTSGALSEQSTAIPATGEFNVAHSVTPPGTAAPAIRSPQFDNLDTLMEDITDVPAGGSLPPVKQPHRPTRIVAPLPLPPSTDAAGRTPVSEPPFFYIQKAHGFKKTKGWPAMFYHKRGKGISGSAAQQQPEAEEQRPAENQLLEVGVVVQYVEQKTGMFICGFLAGFTSWYAIASQLLYSHLDNSVSDDNFVQSQGFATFLLFYQTMSLPIGSIFFALLAFCLLTIIDRYDVSCVTRADLVKAIRLQNGALPLMLLYSAALIVTLSCYQYDDTIYSIGNDLFIRSGDSATTTTTTTATAVTTKSVDVSSASTTKAPLAPSTSPTALNLSTPFDVIRNYAPTYYSQRPPEQRFLTPAMLAQLKLVELNDRVVLWLRLGFARAACCVLAYLILVITSDEDRLVNYLRSLMDILPSPHNRVRSAQAGTVRAADSAQVPTQAAESGNAVASPPPVGP